MPIFPVQDIGSVQPISAQNLVGSLEAIQNLRSNRNLTDTRNDLMQFNLQNAPDQLARSNQQQDLQRSDEMDKRFIWAADLALRHLKQNDVEGAKRVAQNWKSFLTDNNVTAQEDVDIMIGALESGDHEQILPVAQSLVALTEHGISKGVLAAPGSGETETPAGQREFEALIEGFSPADQETARRVKAGLDPRAVGSAVQTITNLGTADNVAGTVGTLSAADETGKLEAQLELKPEIEAAVTTARARATLLADDAKLNKSNANTFEVYNTGMAGLVAALDSTFTGPFVGMIPALSTNQQISDGAIAAMAPVMKQMFRAAGEGIFTDKDQELLLLMIPDRSDRPAARKAKLANIDAIVRAKLGIEEVPVNTAGITPPPEGFTVIE